MGDMANLRTQVNSGAFTSEIDFERNLTLVLNKAQDGHLNFQLDGMAIFTYQRPIPGLVSVSTNGTGLPSIFVYSKCTFSVCRPTMLTIFIAELVSYLAGTSNMPSAVTKINGQTASDFLAQQGQNVTYGDLQDPDALYNQMFYVQNSGQGNAASYGAFVGGQSYPGDNTTIAFANGTTVNQFNVAIFNKLFSFAGLVSGNSYYNLYCNATRKAAQDGVDLNGATRRKRSLEDSKHQIHQHMKRWQNFEKRKQAATSVAVSSLVVSSTASSVIPTATRLTGYPTPVAVSDDLTLSGYFLTDAGFNDTAVLVLQQMSEEDPASFQSTMTRFMNACRQQNKKRLVIDIQGNPGGTVSLGYEVFKQLFPNIYPYAAGNLRAHEGLNTLGTFFTNYTSQLYAAQPNNFTLLNNNNYYSQFSAEAFADDSGSLFKSWPALYGPVKTAKENYTNLIRWDLNDTDFNLASGNIVISGYGNNTSIAASPFTSDNIVLLSDGRCSSTCTIMSHLLKWQGKVKSIAMGGRPANGAMQAIGGVKGSQVYQYYLLAASIDGAYEVAEQLGYTNTVRAFEKSSILGPILNDSDYIVYRGASGGQLPAALSDFTFNFQNNIAENDTSYTPLQFVYEAADCRLWFQPQHISNIRTLWNTVAAQAFGLNNTQQYSLCVQGSTNATSSLSGNATLYNNGVPVNVTSFIPEVAASASSGSSGSSGSGDAKQNSAAQIAGSGIAMVVSVVAFLFTF